jgi:hypothetical protein
LATTQVNSALHYPSGVKVLVTGSAARSLRVESEGDLVRVYYEASSVAQDGDLQACVLVTRE